MVIPAPDSKPLEVHGADGQVIGYILSAEQMSRLRAEVGSLREQLAEAIRQRDHHRAKEVELLTTLHALPPTPDEMADASRWASSDDIRQIISDLESR